MIWGQLQDVTAFCCRPSLRSLSLFANYISLFVNVRSFVEVIVMLFSLCRDVKNEKVNKTIHIHDEQNTPSISINCITTRTTHQHDENSAKMLDFREAAHHTTSDYEKKQSSKAGTIQYRKSPSSHGQVDWETTEMSWMRHMITAFLGRTLTWHLPSHIRRAAFTSSAMICWN